MQWSSYQLAIFDFVERGRGDLAVNAVAGSGKSTVLVEASRRIHSSNALFLAFNKSIVEYVQPKLGPGIMCKTINGLGHGAIMKHLAGRRVTLNDAKYRDIVTDSLSSYGLKGDRFQEASKAVRDVIRFAQSSLCGTDDNSLAELCMRHGIEPVQGFDDREVFSLARHALKTGEEMARQGIISFDDQIWLPVLWGAKPVQAEFVMVDEAQDLSRAKLELVLSARAPGGRMLMVGDPRQAIYGFAGASSDSFMQIVQRTKATELPLSVCYRCPTSVIERARKIVPHIEGRPGAHEGEVRTITEEALPSEVRNGDLILCRLTAPLISMCVKLIAARIPARVKGRDLAKQLVNTAKDALGKCSFDQLDEMLSVYLAAKTEALSKRKNPDSAIQAVQDRCDGVRACMDAFPEAKSLESFAASIEGLFTDGTSVVELSTVHRAKGLEADRVFILKPDKLPLTWKNQQDWEYAQEVNLRYVALTRARQSLAFVVEAKEGSGKPVETAQEPLMAPTLAQLFPEAPAGSEAAKAVVLLDPHTDTIGFPTSLRFACECGVCGARWVSTERDRTGSGSI